MTTSDILGEDPYKTAVLPKGVLPVADVETQSDDLQETGVRLCSRVDPSPQEQLETNDQKKCRYEYAHEIVRGLGLEPFSSNFTETPTQISSEEPKDEELDPLNAFAAREILTKRTLTKDTFSFLLVSKHLASPSSLLTMLVFAIQVIIFGLVAADVIDLANKGNPFNLPANVESTVRMTEVLAIVIAIITQDDVRTSINLLRDGYDKEALSVFPGSTKAKWVISIFLRGSEGILGLFVTFLLVMQSSTVLDLLLNFSAMEFVSLIDDVVFGLTTEGFFGRAMKKEAKFVSHSKYYIVSARHSKLISAITAGYFIVLLAIMLTGWGFIFSKQSSGAYLCNQIYVQFDDTLLPALGTFAGIYSINKKLKFGRRVTYINGNNKIGYCVDEKVWSLAVSTHAGDEADPCDWIASSSESLDFDVTGSTSSQWFVKTDEPRILPLKSFKVTCYDCKDRDNFCGELWSHGICENNVCSCNEDLGRYGLRCEFDRPCHWLEVDPQSKGFIGYRKFATKYLSLPKTEINHRPVYASSVDEETPIRDSDIMFFTGTRWAITNVAQLHDFYGDEKDSIETLASFLSGSFHSYYSDYEVAFLSEAVEIDGDKDGTASPLGLEWYHASAAKDVEKFSIQRPDTNRNAGVNLICGACNNATNPCFFEATCLPNGTCESQCRHGTKGTLCQIAPLGDGKCDDFFNKKEYDYDSGDCCESTCISTAEFSCGKENFGYTDIGFGLCKAQKDLWELSGQPVYGISISSQSGASTAIGGRNGNILAIGDPGAGIVRLFDRDGSEWVQRGSHIEGPPNSEFGLAISMSQTTGNVVKNQFTSPTVSLAVGGPGKSMTRVYDCTNLGCMQVGADLIGGGRFGASVAISSDGRTVAIGSAKFETPVEVYDRYGNDVQDFVGYQFGYDDDYFSGINAESSQWTLRLNATVPLTSAPWKRAAISFEYEGYYVSLSGKGDKVAIGTIVGTQYSNDFGDQQGDLVVDVYQWNAPEWIRLGQAIRTRHFRYSDSIRFIWPLKSLALSSDGLILAIGSRVSTDVYAWDDVASDWIPRENKTNDANELGSSGWSVDLNLDGSILAIGTSKLNAGIDDESIRLYRWNGTRYNTLSNGIAGGEASSIALSTDGMSLAVGLPYYGHSGGVTRVYKFNPSSECDDGFKLLRLSFTTDFRPKTTSWELQVGSMEKISSPRYNGFPSTTFVEETCVPDGECIRFTVYDSVGSGLNPPGNFALLLDGNEVASGGEGFDFFETARIGECDCPEGESLFTFSAVANYFAELTWSLSYQNGLEEYLGGSIKYDYDSPTTFIEECIPTDCWVLNLHPSDPYCEYIDECLPRLVDNFFRVDVLYNKEVVYTNYTQEFCYSSILIGDCAPVK